MYLKTPDRRRWIYFHLLNRLQGGRLQLVGVDEPLLGGPEEHRLLGPPVVGVRVCIRLLKEYIRVQEI